MDALALTIAIFAALSLVGLAVLETIPAEEDPARRLLLAPIVGSAACLLPLFWSNRAGIGVGSGAPWVVGALLGAAALVLAIRRPVIAAKTAWLHAPALLAALLLLAPPMLEFGFDWIAYANGDMVHYGSAARSMLERGVRVEPDVRAIVEHRDEPWIETWMFYGRRGERPGVPLAVAAASAIGGVSPHRAFMPAFVALHLAALWSLAALVRGERGDERTSSIAALLAGVSALGILAVVYQMAGQIWGLGLLWALAAVVLRPVAGAGPAAILRRAALAAVLAAALLLTYFEVAPFLAVAVLAFVAFGASERRVWKKWLAFAAVGAGLVVAALGAYLLPLLGHFESRAGGGAVVEYLNLVFPVFLGPLGFATAAGLVLYGGGGGDVATLAAVVAGAVLAVVAIAATARGVRRREPAALLAAALLLLGVVYLVRPNGYRVFKLVLWANAPLFGVLAVAVTRATATCGRRGLALAGGAALALLGLANAATAWRAVERSRALGPSANLTEIPRGSSSRVLSERERLAAAITTPAVILDVPNDNLARLVAEAVRGHAIDLVALSPGMLAFVPPIDAPGELRFDARPIERKIDLRPAGEGPGVARFSLPRRLLPPDVDPREVSLVAATPLASPFNRRRLGDPAGAMLVAMPWSEVRNHLLFTPSSLGHTWGTSAYWQTLYDRSARARLGLAAPSGAGLDAERITLHPLEADPAFPGRSMAAIGRHLLWHVAGGTPGARLVLDLRPARGGDRLDGVAVIGRERVPLGALGSGSARVVAPPVEPQTVEGHEVLALDLGIDGRRIAAGGEALRPSFDHRAIAAFVRDVSLISEDELRAWRPPSAIRTFPADLGHAELEFAGIHEDGWIGDAARVVLERVPGAELVIRGLVPRRPEAVHVPVRRTFEVIVDGRSVARRTVEAEFEIRADAGDGGASARIEIRADGTTRTSAADPRDTSALLRFVGFEPRP